MEPEIISTFVHSCPDRLYQILDAFSRQDAERRSLDDDLYGCVLFT